MLVQAAHVKQTHDRMFIAQLARHSASSSREDRLCDLGKALSHLLDPLHVGPTSEDKSVGHTRLHPFRKGPVKRPWSNEAWVTHRMLYPVTLEVRNESLRLP